MKSTSIGGAFLAFAYFLLPCAAQKVSGITLSEALDAANLDWTTWSTDGEWIPQAEFSYDGEDAAAVSCLDEGGYWESTRLLETVVTGPGILRWRSKVTNGYTNEDGTATGDVSLLVSASVDEYAWSDSIDWMDATSESDWGEQSIILTNHEEYVVRFKAEFSGWSGWDYDDFPKDEMEIPEVKQRVSTVYLDCVSWTPAISNVRAQQREGTNLVDIWYDASPDFADAYAVRVEVSDDGGETYDIPVSALSGDIGEGIVPGHDKHIVWDAGTDWKDSQSGTMRTRVAGALCHVFHGVTSSPTNAAPEVVEDFSSWPDMAANTEVDTDAGSWTLSQGAVVRGETTSIVTNIITRTYVRNVSSGAVGTSVIPGWFVIVAKTDSGYTAEFTDDGNGVLVGGQNGDGAINYQSGAWSIPTFWIWNSGGSRIVDLTVTFAGEQVVSEGDLFVELSYPEEGFTAVSRETYHGNVSMGIIGKEILPGSVTALVTTHTATAVFNDNGEGVLGGTYGQGAISYGMGLWRLPLSEIVNAYGNVERIGITYAYRDPTPRPQLFFPSLMTTLSECRMEVESVDGRECTMGLFSTDTGEILASATLEAGGGRKILTLEPVEPVSPDKCGIGCMAGTMRIRRIELWTLPPEVSTDSNVFACDTRTVDESDHTITTPEPIPYAWLRGYYPDLPEEYGAYESAALATAANGVNKVWECYVAGISPADEDARFQATITMDADGKPVLSHLPPLSAEEEAKREFRIHGAKSLDAPEPWDDVTNLPDPDAAGYRFFKATVRMRK